MKSAIRPMLFVVCAFFFKAATNKTDKHTSHLVVHKTSTTILRWADMKTLSGKL